MMQATVTSTVVVLIAPHMCGLRQEKLPVSYISACVRYRSIPSEIKLRRGGVPSTSCIQERNQSPFPSSIEDYQRNQFVPIYMIACP